ncbi:glycerol dehydrogenase [Enterococcus florum]|uniref:Glycerol dehydrogenase n=1 Tax=Enterococcus florum TaxID=2480627 RepID=A0A4P5PSE7_9ENTE|nr:iron-containing alcohol dehydrogenase family protein [Enterococcus florum]GCF95563.1 glycerol dehydrogenase [Enterococcus florum]
MSQPLIVRGAPQEYEINQHAWQLLPAHLNKRKLAKLLILHGDASWRAVQQYFPDVSDFAATFCYYGGQCTDVAADHFAGIAQEKQAEAIIAVGGGKVADLAKLTAFRLHLPIIILPTLAATCAAYTPLSVVYNEEGVMLRYDIFHKATDLVLIDPEIILHSPYELMVAGIGDTLAKWYEADAVISQLTVKAIEIQVAEFAAKKCRDLLLAESRSALQAMKNKTLNQAFIDVVETNILLAGMVGGFGDEYGRTSGAHSIHDALTELPQSHHLLHGNKVAYGILVQLMIEGKTEEIHRLLPFYRELQLPASLEEMGLNLTEAEFQTVGARAAEPNENIHFMKQTITSEVVVAAMKQLERLKA